jgi:hypothetical protein
MPEGIGETSDFLRQVEDGISQAFFVHPTPSHQKAKSNHQPTQGNAKTPPTQQWQQPRAKVFRRPEKVTARISVEQRRLVADIKPLGQEGQKEFVPTVFGGGVAEGVDDLGHQNLKAVVPDPSGADGKDEVNGEQLRRRERVAAKEGQFSGARHEGRD